MMFRDNLTLKRPSQSHGSHGRKAMTVSSLRNAIARSLLLCQLSHSWDSILDRATVSYSVMVGKVR